MRIDVITLFPEIINSIFTKGVTGLSVKNNIIDLQAINLRQFADDAYQRVDDRPYGGGPGMVISSDVVNKSFAFVNKHYGCGYKVYLTPQGKKLSHDLVKNLAAKEHLVLLCGRYEGIDERVIEKQIDLECSLGDFVLSGGELAAAAVIDSVARVIPGTLGNDKSADNDSFANGLLDHSHYTRPESVDGDSVPDVLLSGNHQAIAQYRLQQALGNSWIKRPDLFAKKSLSELELYLLNKFLKQYRN